MVDGKREARERVEEERRREKAEVESRAEADATREKTARLKSLRLAKKAADEAPKAIPIEDLNASNDE